MTAYFVRRLIGMAINLLLVTVFVFFMLRLLPGDPTAAILGESAGPEQMERFRELHGLNKPVYQQYFDWVAGLLQGDLGRSLRTSFPVTDEFMARLPRTIELVIISFTITVGVGLIGGIYSATNQNSAMDYGFRIFAVAGLSVPSFLLLTLLLIIPTRLFDYAPPFGAVDFLDAPLKNLQLMVPPAALLAIGSAAPLMRLTRTAFLDVFRQDYMRTARAKGLTERAVTYRHGFRNALPPVLTLAALQLGNLLGGTIVLEQVFGLDGIGLWTLQAISFSDFPVIMIAVLWGAVLLMTISLAVDLSYALIDPRIRY